MTKRELQHMIYMTEAKTKFHIKRGKMGERKGERDYGYSQAICMRRNTKYILKKSIS